MESYFCRCFSDDSCKEEEDDDKKYEFQRLLSLRNWPQTTGVFRTHLANAGFYYTGFSDEVVCFCCGCRKSNWKESDVPVEIHKSLNSSCPFVNGEITDNVAIPRSHVGSNVYCDSVNLSGSLFASDLNTKQYYFPDNDNCFENSIDTLLNSDTHTVYREYERNRQDSRQKDHRTDLCSGVYEPTYRHCDSFNPDSGLDSVNPDSRVESINPESVVNSNNVDSGLSISDDRESDQLNYWSFTEPERFNNETVIFHPEGQAEELDTPYQVNSESGSGTLNSVADRDSASECTSPGRAAAETSSASIKVKIKIQFIPTSITQQNTTITTLTTTAAVLKMNPTNPPRSLQTDSVLPRRDAQVNNNTSNNVPRHTDNLHDMSPVKPGQDIGPLKFERNRLATFENWPPTAEVDPVVLAKSGFRYTKNGDRVQCVFCKVILRNWEPGDVVHIEHRNLSPLCPFLNGFNVGNVPIPPEQRVAPRIRPAIRGGHLPANVVESMSDLETLGVNTVRPKHPQYAIESSRVVSFTNWPPHKRQTPEQLAKAGFFYAGISDNVKCFFCDGGLRNFDASDDPWVEHAKYFPTCRYLLQCKGQGFVNAKRNHGRERTLEEVLAMDEQRQIGVSEVDEREVRARLDLPFVKTILEMGFSRDMIKRVIRKRLEVGGDFSSPATLLEATLAEQVQEEQVQNTSGSQIGSQVNDPIQRMTGNQSDSRSDGGAQNVLMTQEPETGASENEETVASQQAPSIISREMDEEETDPKSIVNKQLFEENQKLKDERLCKICLTEESSIAFLPCGHLVSCAACAPALSQCPVCRETIKGTIRTYLS